MPAIKRIWNVWRWREAFDSFPELKREQYFAVNSKGEVFLETLMRYGNRYQADKAAAVNSLFGGENVMMWQLLRFLRE